MAGEAELVAEPEPEPETGGGVLSAQTKSRAVRALAIWCEAAPAGLSARLCRCVHSFS